MYCDIAVIGELIRAFAENRLSAEDERRFARCIVERAQFLVSQACQLDCSGSHEGLRAAGIDHCRLAIALRCDPASVISLGKQSYSRELQIICEGREVFLALWDQGRSLEAAFARRTSTHSDWIFDLFEDDDGC